MLYADGHVDWRVNSWAGINYDNIYAPAAVDSQRRALDPPSVNVDAWPEPQFDLDTVLVPAFKAKD